MSAADDYIDDRMFPELTQAMVAAGESMKSVARQQAQALASATSKSMDQFGEPKITQPNIPVELLSPDASEILRNGENATLDVDGWTRLIAGRENDEGGTFSQALHKHTGRSWPNLIRELFAELFDSTTEAMPEPLGPDAPWVAEVRGAAHELDSWERLAERCQGEPMLASMATHTVAMALGDEFPPPAVDAQTMAYAAEMAADMAKSQPTPKRIREAGDAARRAQTAADAVCGSAEAVSRRRDDMRRAIRGAVAKAEAAVDEFEKANAAFGWGSQAGSGIRVDGSPKELHDAMRRNSELRQIIELAGRMKTRAKVVRKTKSTRQPEQLVGITIGGDVGRLLPSEIGLLGSAATEDLLYRKVLERGALQHRLEGNERVAKGPIIFCVDESSSMRGWRNRMAKAAALAMMEVAGREKRVFALVHFDTMVHRTDRYDPPKAMKLADMIEALTYFASGGTSFEAPLKHAANLLSLGQLKKADVILLTDGQARHPTKELARLGELGANLHGIAIESSFSTELQKACETYSEILSADNENGFDAIFGV
jgi:sarcosine oxidase delta subunit